MVCFISLIFFHSDVRSIQSPAFHLVGLENVGGGAVWNSVFHETVVFFNVGFWFMVAPHVNVGDGVPLREMLECSEWVDAGAGHH